MAPSLRQSGPHRGKQGMFFISAHGLCFLSVFSDSLTVNNCRRVAQMVSVVSASALALLIATVAMNHTKESNIVLVWSKAVLFDFVIRVCSDA